MRISRHQMFLEIAQVVAKRSTCFRESVGAIIVKDNRIISIGYNGPPSKEDPCSHHPEGRCERAIHAEVNAIKFMKGKSLNNCDLYCTHLPCPACLMAITNAGLFKRVFFNIIYGPFGASEDAWKQLDRCGIQLWRVLPSGAITTHDRQELVNVE